MKDTRIFANLIEAKKNERPDLDVLTFATLSTDGTINSQIRTYQNLWDNGQRLANALVGAGMRRGDKFALLMQNHPEFVDAMVASSLIGSVFVPIDPRTDGDKLKYMIEFSGCKGVICADYCYKNLEKVADQIDSIEWIWVMRTGEIPVISSADNRISDYNAVQSETYEPVECCIESPSEIMQMLYTSGTTGDPKAILAPYERYDNVASIGPALGMKPDDRPYTGLSLTHANAQLITLGNVLKMGMRGVISRKFTKTHLWDICRHYGCTVFNLLGGMTNAIYSEPRRDDDADNPVRYVISAGMPGAIWNDFKKRFDVDIFEFYGAAEGGMLFNPPNVGPIGSIGKPPESLVAKIVDDDGNEVPDGERGEITFESANGEPLAVSYYKNEEASRKKCRDGILYMGDIGHRDKDGWFFFHSRKGDELRRNGEFIDIAKIEKVIAEFPDVEDVFVYGIPASTGVPGEKDIVAAVVPTEAKIFKPTRLIEHCKQFLNSSEKPSFIQLMSEIPKTASEKPQARFCYELFKAKKKHVYDCESELVVN
ncbi:MAG: ATP-dependent acyl-CoA ligase [Spongiibacteraceae bacterium]|jgi:carnitine-CoA ligase|nr:ATP-dependent acyl-CoA ligase [Spongiibacteraceae bacterium]